MFNLKYAIVFIVFLADTSSAYSGTKSIGENSFTSTAWVPFSGIAGAKEKALEIANSNCVSREKKLLLKNLSGHECGLHGGCGKAEISYLCLSPNDPRLHPPEEQNLLDSKDDERCKSFGAKLGTDAYVNCRLKLLEIRSQSDGSQAAAPAPTAMTRSVCIRIPMGNLVTTQCRQVTN